MRVDTNAEDLHLRAVLRDLVALSAIPAMWIGSEPPEVAAGLADALFVVLQLDFAFVRLGDSGRAGPVEVTRGSAWTGFPDWLEEHLATSAPFPRNEVVPDVGDESALRRGFAVPIGVNGEGGLVAAASERSDFPTPTDHLLLSVAANHAAVAFESARLPRERKRAEEELRNARNELEVKVAERTAELYVANDDLAASRRRIVTASDEVRRRIERSLHDGVQQQLVWLTFQLQAMDEAMPPNEALKSQLAHIASALSNALEDLVEISRGIHPALLSEGGLGPALEALARRSVVPVELDAHIDDRLPEQVEVAAYYVLSEALTNAAKHARASVVHVGVVEQEGSVRLSIRDDGVGGADPGRGSGLVGLQDRVAALGGTIDIESAPGSGTLLLITLPLRIEPMPA